MKVISFLILCSLIIYINTEETCNKKIGSSSKDCKDTAVQQTGDHCCFMKVSFEIAGQKGEKSGCFEITQSDYDKIDEAIKNMEKEVENAGGKATIDTLDCKSSYIALSLFSLLLFIL